MTLALRIGAGIAAVAAAALLAAAAQAGERINAAVAALATDPVYVDPDAEPGLTGAEAERVRARISAADTPLYVAVLPDAALDEAGGSAEAVLEEVARGLDRRGTYAVVVGGRFRGGSNVLSRGVAPDAATRAFEAHGDEGVAATLVDFVDRIAQADTRGGEPSGGGDDGGAGGGAWLFLLFLLLPLAVIFLRRRGRDGRRIGASQPEFADVRTAAEEELLALADDVRALDLDIEMPSATAEAKAAYGRALAAYERADAALDRARSLEDIEPVTSAVEEGRYWIEATRASLEGREPPERRPPCFFDPRHGPSVRDVEWAPPGGTPRLVPACAADAIQLEEGIEPEMRQVPYEGRRVPYWEAGPAYGPWAGGFFGAGLLPAILFGSMLGSGLGFGGPFVIDGGDEIGGEGDFGGDLGGGDFGGDVGGGGDF